LSLGQAAHLAGHDGKAAALLAGPAASTAAFSARMLVWNAMPSMVPMMSPILRLLAWISSIVATTCDTTAAAALGHARGRFGQLARHRGAVGGAARAAGQLLHRTGGLLQVGSTLLGAGGQVAGSRRRRRDSSTSAAFCCVIWSSCATDG
jgi:hypothetical protein